MKYINADRLKAEIEKQMESVKRHSDLGEPDDLYYDGKRSVLVMLRSFINSLQQEMWKPSYEQMKALEVAGKTFASFKELNMNTQRAWKIFHEPLESLGNDLAKLMKL